jgi:hypothetical protein
LTHNPSMVAFTWSLQSSPRPFCGPVAIGRTYPHPGATTVNRNTIPTSAAAPRRLTATQLLTRLDTYTRKQQLPSNFLSWQLATGANICEATTIPISRLISMLDSDHCKGSHFAVVSKASTRGKYVSTVLDVPLRKVFRARHETGMVSFWKGVAKRRPQVKFLAAGDPFSQ